LIRGGVGGDGLGPAATTPKSFVVGALSRNL
jgi:hypothetical protein